MEVPCPVPLSKPWSPVGYQVFQVGSEQLPPSPPPLDAAASSKPRRLPASPVGYRVVVVSDEVVPVTPPPRPPRRRSKKSSPPPSNPWVLRGVIAGAALLFLAPVSLMILMMSTRHSRPEPAVAQVVIPDGLQVVDLGAVPAKVPPAAAAEQPAAVQEKPPALAFPDIAKDQCVDCEKNGKPAEPGFQKMRERETFGTQVQFLHNPQAAAKAAKEENKLTFLLHVSGNFENDEFT